MVLNRHKKKIQKNVLYHQLLIFPKMINYIKFKLNGEKTIWFGSSVDTCCTCASALEAVLPMSLGSEVKSRMGTGIFLTMYSHTTSMLYLSWAEMGMMGAPSATVPAGWDSSTAQRSGH